jgi:hypothetical protein
MDSRRGRGRGNRAMVEVRFKFLDEKKSNSLKIGIRNKETLSSKFSK